MRFWRPTSVLLIAAVTTAAEPPRGAGLEVPAGAWVVTTTAEQPRGAMPQAPKGTGIIRGIVVESSETPVARLTVEATRYPSERGGRPQHYRATTDEAGAFEIRELPAGRYRVAARVPGPTLVTPGLDDRAREVELAEGQVVEKVTLRISRAGVITGRVVNENGEPVAYVRVSAERRQSGIKEIFPITGPRETDDLGRFRLFGLPPGEYYVKVESLDFGSDLDEGSDEMGYLDGYYPNAATGQEAQPIAVAAGQETGEIEVWIRRGRTFRVAGVVLDANGAPASHAFVAYSAGDGMSALPTRPDGSFELSRLKPAEYVVTARTHRLTPEDDLEASPELTLHVDRDIEGLTLMMRREARVAGRILIEGDPPLLRPGEVQVMAVPARQRLADSREVARAREDGTFTIRAVGPTFLRVNETRPEWRLKAVRYKGVDVTDAPTEFGESADPSQLELVVSNRGGKIAGHVLDAGGKPATHSLVMVFAEDRRLWFLGASTTWFGVVEEDGRFEVGGLRPETYQVVAINRPGSFSLCGTIMKEPDPVFEQLAPQATAVAITGKERREVTLTLATPPR